MGAVPTRRHVGMRAKKRDEHFACAIQTLPLWIGSGTMTHEPPKFARSLVDGERQVTCFDCAVCRNERAKTNLIDQRKCCLSVGASKGWRDVHALPCGSLDLQNCN